MKVWNTGTEEIKQKYNSKVFVIPPNTMAELNDDLVAFLLAKPEVRGRGLVQVKDGDNKEERYRLGRENVYKRALIINEDYDRHCEEREQVRKLPLRPHKEILEAKEIIAGYEKWLDEGKPVPKEIKGEKVGETKVFVCPHCSKEFGDRVAYFGHMRSHEKEKNDDTVNGEDKGKGKD